MDSSEQPLAHQRRSLQSPLSKAKARAASSAVVQRLVHQLPEACLVTQLHKAVPAHRKETKPRQPFHPLPLLAIHRRTPYLADPSRTRTSNLQNQQLTSLPSASHQAQGRVGRAVAVVSFSESRRRNSHLPHSHLAVLGHNHRQHSRARLLPRPRHLPAICSAILEVVNLLARSLLHPRKQAHKPPQAE